MTYEKSGNYFLSLQFHMNITESKLNAGALPTTAFPCAPLKFKLSKQTLSLTYLNMTENHQVYSEKDPGHSDGLC